MNTGQFSYWLAVIASEVAASAAVACTGVFNALNRVP